jgi:hypothetical protein
MNNAVIKQNSIIVNKDYDKNVSGLPQTKFETNECNHTILAAELWHQLCSSEPEEVCSKENFDGASVFQCAPHEPSQALSLERSIP